MDSRKIKSSDFTYGIVSILISFFFIASGFNANAQDKASGFVNQLIQENTIGERIEFIQDNPNFSCDFAGLENAISGLKKALAKDSTNYNLNYKLGLAYYFSYDERYKALPFLKKAIKGTALNYNFLKGGNQFAPVTANYFLAQAYLYNNQYDSALFFFRKYLDAGSLKPISVEHEISFCLNALRIQPNKEPIELVRLENGINSTSGETNPALDSTGTKMAFASRRGSKAGLRNGSSGIYFTEKDPASGKWNQPVAFQFNGENDLYPLCYAEGGKKLYFSVNVNGQLDVFYSIKENEQWKTPIAFNWINSPTANENGLCFSADYNTLFFSSDRNKKEGHYDIYKSVWKDNKWSIPERLSIKVNTFMNETNPFCSPDGKRLFFAGNGYASSGIGGFDIYFTDWNEKDSWSVPQNLGLGINSTANELNYVATGKRTAVVCKLNNENSYDLFEVKGIGTEVNEVKYNLSATSTVKEVRKEVQTVVEKVVHDTVKVIVYQEIERKVPVVGKMDTAKTVKTLSGSTSVQEVNKNFEKKDSAIFKIVYFDLNKSNLNLLSTKELELLLAYLKQYPAYHLNIIGHSDNTGGEKLNLQLSERRAKMVAMYIQGHSTKKLKIHVSAMGGAKPAYPNDNEEHMAKNRRVEIYLSK